MAKSNPVQRVVLMLDPRIALEAIILNRLDRLPRARRQEWLRGLLLQGFRVECQTLRATPSRAPVGHASRPGRLNPITMPTSDHKPNSVPEVAETMVSRIATKEKPFAALGKVIG